MNLDNLTIADFEEVTKLTANIYFGNGETLYESIVLINYNEGKPTSVCIDTAYSNPYLSSPGFIESLAKIIPLLKVDSLTKSCRCKIPYIEHSRNRNYRLWAELYPKVESSDYHSFRITSNKILNYYNLASVNQPNSYTITIDYL